VRYRSFMRSCEVSLGTAWEIGLSSRGVLHTTWFCERYDLRGSGDPGLPRRVGDRHPPDLASENLQCTCAAERLNAIVDIEFEVDIFHMRSRGVRRNHQGGGNFWDRSALGH
jgi:hypothetical protein